MTDKVQKHDATFEELAALPLGSLVTRDWKQITEGAWSVVSAGDAASTGPYVTLRRGYSTLVVYPDTLDHYDLKIADGYEGPRA